MESSFGQGDKSTVFHHLQSSEWWATDLCWNGDYSSSWIFCFIQSQNFDKVPKFQQHWLHGRSGLCLIINVGFRPPPPLRHVTLTTRSRMLVLI